MLLEVNRLIKSFGGLRAINDLSLSVDTGDILGLIGPNGSGKTTFFNLVTGFLSADSGEVLFDSKEITKWKPHRITALGLARTFQHPKPLMHLTAHENIRIAAFLKNKKEKDAAEKGWEILELMGGEHIGKVLTSQLTFVQKKIVDLGRALATEPKLLCVDEIMAGLNWNESMEIIKTLRKIHSKSITLILIEHNMSAILEISKRIAVINFGNKIADGEPEEVLNSKQVIEAYLGTGEAE